MKQEEQITIKDLLLGVIKVFKNAKKNWKLILAFMIVGGIVGFYMDYNKSKNEELFYKATNIIYLETATPQVDMGGLAGLIGGNVQTSTGLFNGKNLTVLISSWDFLQRVFFKTININGKPKLLINYYLEKNVNPLKKDEESKDENGKEIKKVTINSLSGDNLSEEEYLCVKSTFYNASVTSSLEQEPGTSFYNLTVKSYDDTLSKVYSDVFLQTLKEYYLESNNGKINDRLKNQQRVVDSLRNKLLGSESMLAKAKDQNEMVVFEAGRVNEARLQRNNQIYNQSYLEQSKILENLKLQLYQNSPLFRITTPQKFPLQDPIVNKTSYYINGAILGLILAIIFLTIQTSIKKILAEG